MMILYLIKRTKEKLKTGQKVKAPSNPTKMIIKLKAQKKHRKTAKRTQTNFGLKKKRKAPNP